MAEIVFDGELKARLVAFQRAHGLAEDGMVGAKTWTVLAEQSVAKPAAASSASSVRLTAEHFPWLFSLADAFSTEQGVKDYLREQAGVDLDEILANIAAVLES